MKCFCIFDPMFSLVEALVERDEFGCLIKHIPKNSHFSFALTCHGAHKEVSTFYKNNHK